MENHLHTLSDLHELQNLPKRRVQRVRHEIKQRDVEVIRISPLGANFISITFKGDSLQDFVSDSFDDHVKFTFLDQDGELVRRDYTPRHFDRAMQELTIEFACHGDGKASAWARKATVGQRAIIAGPRGSMIIPMDYDWHLFAGDATALPAIRRRLDELPSGARAMVVALAGDAADQAVLSSHAALQLVWVSSDEELLATLRAIQLPEGEGFAWCAGEAALMAQLRDLLRQEKRLSKEAMRVAAYWKHDASNFHENLE